MNLELALQYTYFGIMCIGLLVSVYMMLKILKGKKR